LTQGDVNEAYLEYLNEFNRRMLFVESNKQKDIRAILDIEPKLNKLHAKVRDSHNEQGLQ
jgi:hypothetical protein